MKVAVMLACLVGLAGSAAGGGTEPIKTLLITGKNNHNWPYTSRVHAETLEMTGRFSVTITDEPGKMLEGTEALRGYQLIVLDYNDAARWGETAEKAFTDAVRGGTGVVAIHAANNAFPGWAEYEQMLGLMWRDGAGHGKFHRFEVKIPGPKSVEEADREHPIVRQMPRTLPVTDELYHGLSNPQKSPYTLLATALSSVESGGSGKDEPMALTLQFGKGRIFATPLGHVWTSDPATKISVTEPPFRMLLTHGAEWAATGGVAVGMNIADGRPHNVLSDEEKRAGWTLLFDGKTTTMRGFKKDAMPTEGWTIRNGLLVHEKGKGGGDIVTPMEYGDFEFAVDWKATEGANSGIIYHCTEDHNNPWETGIEMQILDDAKHADGKSPLTRAGTMYALFPTAVDVARPPGVWNHARVVCRGRRVEHWLNGFKVVDVDLDSDAYKAAHAKSKFTKMPDFATRDKGHIALQDHGDEVIFRNLKVRSLKVQ